MFETEIILRRGDTFRDPSGKVWTVRQAKRNSAYLRTAQPARNGREIESYTWVPRSTLRTWERLS
jgi:hypothetical protein